MGGAAAQRNHAVTVMLLIEGETGLHIGVLGVGFRAAEYCGFNAGLLQNILNLRGHGMVSKEAVGDDHSALSTETVHQSANLGHGTGAKYVAGGKIIVG